MIYSFTMALRARWLVGATVATSTAIAVACGSTGEDSTFDPGAADATTSSSGASGTSGFVAGDGSPNDTLPISITPADPVITVKAGQTTPTVQLTAIAGGAPVAVAWSLDRGEIGSIGEKTGLFTPSGNFGGKITVTASAGARTAKTSLTVKLQMEDNGGVALDAGGGAGGSGGVGGEGPGAAVDAATKAILDGASSADAGLAWLYPYEATVWPRGILAPLLQWQNGAQGDYDAVRIRVTETNFQYTGYFKKTAAPFVHHPIPQAAWKALTQSNGGEEVVVDLTFAAGGKAWGPITERWKIAGGSLKGTVYYNSYGTRLAKNYGGAIGGDGMFGGATLGIRGGSTDPTLVAGGNGDASYCRVCHSVAANGSSLITQRKLAEDYLYSSYDLKTGAETAFSAASGLYSWPAVSPDGTFFFSDSSALAGSGPAPSALFAMPGGAVTTPTPIASTGLPAGLRAAMPVFAPNAKAVAFNFFGGPAGADQRSLAWMPFDLATKAFGAIDVLYTPPAAGHTAVWPSFTPTNDAVVFQVETKNNGRDFGGTRSTCDGTGACNDDGARGELWWVDLKTKTARRLDKLNGLGYLPQGAAAHGDDATLNYEPTVNPVPSGGYAWVVFTSRRLYGNVATINPWSSDPRFRDLTSTPTPKKLWVAAIDLNAPAGTDPSHPAFYLPAQELLAGNSRGYWVVDPCKQDGSGCETGDECCNGYCRPGTGGALVCTSTVPTCAEEFEKCTKASDCCGAPAVDCVGGRCAVTGPK